MNEGRTDLIDRIGTWIIMVCSVSLSIGWALTVPIFENMDEPVHWQYAYDIATTGRIILGREGVSTVANNSAFTYLVRRSEFKRIAFRKNEKVSPRYGTPHYFQEIDDQAPALDRVAYLRAHTTPLLVNAYPFGYYALTGFWMGAVSIFRRGIVEMFFAARILSSILFAATLVLLDAIMRRVSIDAITRLLLLASIGLAPMVTMVSASVQPDVLIGLLLTATAYGLLRYRKTPTTRWAIVICGILTFASLVKLHYAMTGIVAAAIVIGSGTLRIGARSVLMHIGILAVGIIAAQIVQFQISWQPRTLYDAETHGIWQAGPLVAAAHAGVVPFMKNVLPTTASTIQYLFVNGFVPHEFLGDYGWVDTPEHFPDHLQRAIVEANAVTFNAMLLFLGLASIIVVALRLARIGRRRGWYHALSTFGADPVLAIVLLYDAGMVALALYAPYLGYVWRYWFPVYGLIVISIARFVPRFLWYPMNRRFVSRLFALILFAWGLYGSSIGAGTIRERYYVTPYGTTSVTGAANIRRSLVSASQAKTRNI